MLPWLSPKFLQLLRMIKLYLIIKDFYILDYQVITEVFSVL